MTCPPGEHPHADRRNFTLGDYVEMCRAGTARFTIAEAARVAGVSRAKLYRWVEMASIPENEFEDVLDWTSERGLSSTTAIVDEIKRRTGRAKNYDERCPHCGEVVRTRRR